MTYNIDPDYVDVATRIQEFYAKYPDGRLQTIEHDPMEINGKWFVYCKVAAYRDADDPRPSHGLAWEPIPGPTPFTKDSELMNAQTSAWGRAIVATGIPSKKIASADEVRARDAAARPQPQTNGGEDRRTDAQNRKMRAVISELDKKDEKPPDGAETWATYAKRWTFAQFGKESSKDLTKAEAGKLIDHLEAMAVPFG